MSKLQVKNLHKPKTSNLLTVPETSFIVGGTVDILIESSFNDTVIGGSGNDVIITDPMQVSVNGREIYNLEDFF
ncbi:MAG: hypothetical protein AAF383_27200 [Cyanobacteria bacterium P01_A01_bin.83]